LKFQHDSTPHNNSQLKIMIIFQGKAYGSVRSVAEFCNRIFHCCIATGPRTLAPVFVLVRLQLRAVARHKMTRNRTCAQFPFLEESASTGCSKVSFAFLQELISLINLLSVIFSVLKKLLFQVSSGSLLYL
ncbi:hypothetical protein J6590_084771, partial [Homalodisca vitripennis]